MEPASIRQHLDHRPFRPFTVRMADGEQVLVRKREWVFLTPSGTTLIVVTGKKFWGDDETRMLHVPWIVEAPPVA